LISTPFALNIFQVKNSLRFFIGASRQANCHGSLSRCFVLLPVSAGFSIAERNGAKATGGRARVGRGCEVQRSEAIPNRTDSGHFQTAAAVCGLPKVSEKPAAQPGAEPRSLPTIQCSFCSFGW